MTATKPKTTSPDDQPLRPFLVTIKTLAILLGRSAQSLARDDKQGKIPAPVKLGSSVRWNYHEILEWTKAKCPSRADWEARAGKSETFKPSARRRSKTNDQKGGAS